MFWGSLLLGLQYFKLIEPQKKMRSKIQGILRKPAHNTAQTVFLSYFEQFIFVFNTQKSTLLGQALAFSWKGHDSSEPQGRL